MTLKLAMKNTFFINVLTFYYYFPIPYQFHNNISSNFVKICRWIPARVPP